MIYKLAYTSFLSVIVLTAIVCGAVLAAWLTPYIDVFFLGNGSGHS